MELSSGTTKLVYWPAGDSRPPPCSGVGYLTRLMTLARIYLWEQDYKCWLGGCSPFRLPEGPGGWGAEAAAVHPEGWPLPPQGHRGPLTPGPRLLSHLLAACMCLSRPGNLSWSESGFPLTEQELMASSRDDSCSSGRLLLQAAKPPQSPGTGEGGASPETGSLAQGTARWFHEEHLSPCTHPTPQQASGPPAQGGPGTGSVPKMAPGQLSPKSPPAAGIGPWRHVPPPPASQRSDSEGRESLKEGRGEAEQAKARGAGSEVPEPRQRGGLSPFPPEFPFLLNKEP